MMLRKVVPLVVALAIALMGVSSYAMPIHFEEGSLTAEADIVRDVGEVLSEAAEEEAGDAEEAGEPAEASEEAEPEEAGIAPGEAEAADEAVEAEEVASAEAEAGEEAAEIEEVAEEGPVAIDVADFHILSAMEDGSLLIFADGQYLKVAEAAMEGVIAQVGAGRIADLPGAGDFVPLARSDRSDDVKALQEMLRGLGYLSGTQDGQYGGQSERAVSSFERDMGLAETGRADQLLQLLMASVLQETVTIVAHFDPVDRFAAIAGKTLADLEAAAESGMTLEYDDIAGTGTISDGTAVALDAAGDSDIDSYSFEIRFVLLVNQSEDGEVIVEPAACVRCECLLRPIVQSIILKSGDTRYTVAVDELQSTLDGARSIETAVVRLDDNTLRMLENAAEEGELKFRIHSKYRSFDGEVTGDSLIAVSNFARIARRL